MDLKSAFPRHLQNVYEFKLMVSFGAQNWEYCCLSVPLESASTARERERVVVDGSRAEEEVDVDGK